MSIRILQIFNFLKMQSKHQSILSHLEREIKNKFKIMLNLSHINLHKILSYVVMISHRRICSIYRHNTLIGSNQNQIKKNKEKSKVWSRVGAKEFAIKSDNYGSLYRKTNSVTSCKQ